MWKRIRWLVWGLFAFLVIYTGISVYFMDRFFPGTSINNTNAEYLTVDQVNELLMSQAQTYKLTLLGREGETEELDSADLGVTYYETDAAGQIKRIQNGFLWLRMFWQRDSYHLTPGVAIDEEQFRAAVRDLELVKNGKHPQNAWVELTEDGYELHEEQPGNRLGIRNLEEQMKGAVTNQLPELNLEEAGCYLAPGITAESEEVTALTEKLDHWLGAEITYEFGPESQVVDENVISRFIRLEGYEASLDGEAVTEWVRELAESRDTYKKPRKFKSTLRGVITVKGGNYGWQIDQETESQELLAHIEQGDTLAKEPAYTQRGNVWSTNYDIGDTYIEVDMGAQHMWFYKNGQLIVDTDVVTGNMSRGYGTPAIVAAVKYKARNAVLRGADYATPVKYWMPFYGNYGIHDASWRAKFGGAIYQTNGSHGCVNTPPANMKILFEQAEKGTPVVLYY